MLGQLTSFLPRLLRWPLVSSVSVSEIVEETSPNLDGGRILHLEMLDRDMGFLEADGSKQVPNVHSNTQR